MYYSKKKTHKKYRYRIESIRFHLKMQKNNKFLFWLHIRTAYIRVDKLFTLRNASKSISVISHRIIQQITIMRTHAEVHKIRGVYDA